MHEQMEQSIENNDVIVEVPHQEPSYHTRQDNIDAGNNCCVVTAMFPWG